jgi:hypothetical protein
LADVAPAEWHLGLRLSGGFAGIDRELRLAHTGELTVTDRRRARTVTSRVPSDALSQVAALVATRPSIDTVRDASCQDCLTYDLEVQTSGPSFTTRLDEVSLAGTGLEDLLRTLVSLLNRALAEGPAR